MQGIMLLLVQSLILAIDLGSGILFLPQRPYIKIVAENAGDGDNGPFGFRFELGMLTLGFSPCNLIGPWSWDALIRQVIGNPLISPTAVV